MGYNLGCERALETKSSPHFSPHAPINSRIRCPQIPSTPRSPHTLPSTLTTAPAKLALITGSPSSFSMFAF